MDPGVVTIGNIIIICPDTVAHKPSAGSGTCDEESEALGGGGGGGGKTGWTIGNR